MLGFWRKHDEYQSYLLEKILPYFESDKENVLQYSDALSKLYILDLDPLESLLSTYYSNMGAPAKNQPELIRSFILMSELKIHSITRWVEKLQANEILCFMVGLPRSEIHQVGSNYDLIDRVWLSNPDVDYEFEHSLHTFKRKPAKKLKKNQKQPPQHPGIIQKFFDLALEGKTPNPDLKCSCNKSLPKLGLNLPRKKVFMVIPKNYVYLVMEPA